VLELFCVIDKGTDPGNGQLSDAIGNGYVATPLQSPGVLFTVTFAGHVIVGGWLSTTVIVKVQAAVPQILVAVAVTMVVPLGKNVPEF
jgi:uncharacterized protein (DUF983 family)